MNYEAFFLCCFAHEPLIKLINSSDLDSLSVQFLGASEKLIVIVRGAFLDEDKNEA
jgi:hypothetical protein